jgi:hypothetical protein
MEIVTQTVKVTTTGSAGVATGTATSPSMHGQLLDIFFDFHASLPATADTTVAFVNPPLGNLIVLSNTATDIRKAPREPVHDATGVAITNAYDRITLNGALSFSIAQGDALTDALVATIRYLRY